MFQYPNAMAHLGGFRAANSCPEVRDKKHPWWSLHRPRDPLIFEAPKFIGLTTSRTIELLYDEQDSLFVTDAMYVFRVKTHVDPWAVMAILQSRPFLFLYGIANQGEARVIPQVKASKLYELPVPLSDLKAEGIAGLSRACKRMMALHASIVGQRLAANREPILRQIEALDFDIDHIVCQLYGLRQSEVSLIERGTT